MIIAGGTGILPFIDLLDLLLKIELHRLLKSKNLGTEIVKPQQDYDSLFYNTKFKLLYSVDSIKNFTGFSWIEKLAAASRKNASGLF